MIRGRISIGLRTTEFGEDELKLLGEGPFMAGDQSKSPEYVLVFEHGCYWFPLSFSTSSSFTFVALLPIQSILPA
jgi:hypothetical protein